jgi:hypothetical protein
MFSLAHQFTIGVGGTDGVVYRARVYGALDDDGRYGGWIVFFPIGGGRVISTDRETTQSSMADLAYWASGLTPTYLEGALARALALEPEAQLARNLEQLERLETSAELRADTLEAEADVARIESKLAEAARERTEEELLATVAERAETDAKLHEAVADVSRKQAQAAERALRSRTSAPKASRKKK